VFGGTFTEKPASIKAFATCAPIQLVAPVTNTTVSLEGVRPSVAAVVGGAEVSGWKTCT